MTEVAQWKVPKWPFLLADAVLIVVAFVLVTTVRHPLSAVLATLVTGCVVLGAVLACWPFLLDYRAMAKCLELNALSGVSEKIADFKTFTQSITEAAGQWARVQEATQGAAEKTSLAAREMADRISLEVQDFTEFQKKMNDAEKNALRLEVEKLRRLEGDWLQVVVRMLDHIYSLYSAATRSGHAELVAEIGSFQNACRDAARRVGLIPYGAEPDEVFDPERHRLSNGTPPTTPARIAQTLTLGFSFQGRLIRPAVVRLAAETPTQAAQPPGPATGELPL